MRLNLPIVSRFADALRRRDWVGISFELFVVALGVWLGLEASRWAEAREEQAYRRHMIAALNETLLNYAMNGENIRTHIVTALHEHSKLRSAGKKPAPPILHITGLDRPPTRTWDALVATGIARSIEPDLLLRLAVFFSRADAYGDQYQRYNEFTEREVLPRVSDTGTFYARNGQLSAAYSSHVDRLRELLESNDLLTEEAGNLRGVLAKKL